MQNKTGTNGLAKLKNSRIFWAVLSLCVALLIWVYYTSNYASEETRTFYGVEVSFTGQDNMRDSLSLVVSDQDAATVNVTLSGSRRDLLRISSEDLRAVVNLSNVTKAGYRTMSYTLSYPSSVNSTNIQVVRQSPQTIGLQISKLATKVVDFSGSFTGTTAEGYMVDTSEMTFDPANLTVIGPEEELEQIATARVTVDRDEVRSGFTTAANFVLLDADGEELTFDDIQMDAESVSVAVPVSTIKEVALDVTLIYGGGAASENVIKEIYPSTITVAGDAAALDGLNSISVATIDLSDYESFPATDYTIILPNGVECLSGETTATVSLTFMGLETAYFTVSNLNYINLPEGYTATIMEQSKFITVRAPEDVLPQVSQNNIRVVADLADVAVTEGTTSVRVPATVYVDGYDAAGAVGDYTLFVRLEAEQ